MKNKSILKRAPDYASMIRVKMRPFLGMISALTLIVSYACSATAQTERPNIVIIVADDLGYADVSFNGGEIQTPAIDSIAKEGVRLDSFYASMVCSPTRAGLMTGRYPIRFGCMAAVIPPWRKGGMPESEHTIAELCAEAGYKRRAHFGKWHLGHSESKYLPLHQGFTHFYGHYNGAIDYFTHMRNGELDWHRNDETVREEGYSTDLLARAAVNFIDESAREKEPFLLYLPFNAPHSPFQATENDLEEVGTVKKPLAIGAMKKKKKNKITSKKDLRSTYAAMVHAMDRGVKDVLDALRENNMDENTLVFFMSDNGGETKVADNTPWRDGKFSVYEGGIRVCAAMHWPAGNIQGGHHITEGPIGYIDLYPTIQNILGLSNIKRLNVIDGVDLLPILGKEAMAPERDWYSYMSKSKNNEHAALIRGNMKLVVRGVDLLGGDFRPELYDLDLDPSEQTNLSESYGELTQSMIESLQVFRSWQRNPLPSYSEGRKGFVAPKDWIVD